LNTIEELLVPSF